MRACNFFCAFTIAFASSVIAVPAVVRIPTAINQAAANPEQGLTITNEYEKFFPTDRRRHLTETDFLFLNPRCGEMNNAFRSLTQTRFYT